SYTSMVALNLWSRAVELMKSGQTAVSTKFEVPKRGTQLGVGFWGAGRGYLSHHLELNDGVVTNYQIITPSTINASPHDPWETPGKYEEAVLNTPILETGSGAYQGIDVLRAIRSFDPCMPCTTHIHSDSGVLTREINTCACGVD
ncbi:MAG: nickel-dependent hydrogenase large subunit, partial [Chloroflexi bacterium]|nr:nickel-dependent hydrogenase large subunit [Chloroflexota bacterium]